MATLKRINQLALHEQAGTSSLADYVREQFSKLGEKASEINACAHAKESDMAEKMTLEEALTKAQAYTVMHGKSGQYPDGTGWGHAWNEEGLWLPRGAWDVIRAHLAQPAQAVDVEREIACALAEADGFDPDDQHGGLYDLRWSGGPAPEPMGDAWTMDYLPKAEQIAKRITRAIAGKKI